MAGKQGVIMMPIVSKVYCSASEVSLTVRRRPRVASGGGFVVADCNQRVVFRVDGCGILGKKGEMILRDGEGNALLLMRQKGSIIEAVSITKKWKGFTYDLLESNKLVFTLKYQTNPCFTNNTSIRISIEQTEFTNYRKFEIRGDFQERSCIIVDSRGDVIAEIGVKKELEKAMYSRDLYDVNIKAGIDQAFVFGVISVLDYIHDGSTRC